VSVSDALQLMLEFGSFADLFFITIIASFLSPYKNISMNYLN